MDGPGKPARSRAGGGLARADWLAADRLRPVSRTHMADQLGPALLEVEVVGCVRSADAGGPASGLAAGRLRDRRRRSNATLVDERAGQAGSGKGRRRIGWGRLVGG